MRPIFMFYLVKVRLQSRELASRYKGTWNCFVTTVKQEKVSKKARFSRYIHSNNAYLFL
jgi:hypothetical protein